MDIIKNVPTKFDMSILGSDGKKIPGLTITFAVYASDDIAEFYGVMDEPIPGIYSVEVTLSELGFYRLCYTTPEGYEDGMQPFTVVDAPAKESTLALENDKLARILGLVQENFRVTNPVYDTNGNLISSTTNIYASASDCNANINPIATYSVVGVYDSTNKLLSYKVTKN